MNYPELNNQISRLAESARGWNLRGGESDCVFAVESHSSRRRTLRITKSVILIDAISIFL